MIRTVTIVSLSAGTLGEPFVRHELELGLSRLAAMGLAVQFAPHALRGREFLSAHPEFRRESFLLPGPAGEVSGGQITLWPQVHGTDGFYICKLRKDGEA